MSHGLGTKYLVALATVLATSAHSRAAESAADPIATRKALAALLASSNAEIPSGSTCQGNYGQAGRPAVKDLVAMQLAYLYSGDNVIEGRCTSNSCAIAIKHASGEDVSSATIEFGVKKGRANAATLRCVITP
jgi:hypothetical protein